MVSFLVGNDEFWSIQNQRTCEIKKTFTRMLQSVLSVSNVLNNLSVLKLNSSVSLSKYLLSIVRLSRTTFTYFVQPIQ